MEKPVSAFVPNFLLGMAGGIQYLKQDEKRHAKFKQLVLKD